MEEVSQKTQWYQLDDPDQEVLEWDWDIDKSYSFMLDKDIEKEDGVWTPPGGPPGGFKTAMVETGLGGDEGGCGSLGNTSAAALWKDGFPA
eukprot:3287013-Karenia_brevis.AAC.1